MATSYLAPGVYMEEVPPATHTIEAVGTSTAAFLGVAPNIGAYPGEAVALNSWSDFKAKFAPEGTKSTRLSHAVYGFFDNGGGRCYAVNMGNNSVRSSLKAVEPYDEIKVIAAPGYSDGDSQDALASFCEKVKFCFAILDAPEEVADLAALTRVATESAPAKPKSKGAGSEPASDASDGYLPRDSSYSAIYFPWIYVVDALSTDPNTTEKVMVPPSGHIAGIYARTDTDRGVHKAPANQVIRGARGLKYRLTRQEQEVLNPAGVNCIRYFGDAGHVVWGARTNAKRDRQFVYVPVRRLTIMAEESILRHSSWAVFEPHDYSLRVRVRHSIVSFLKLLWGQGALMGETPEQAFFVKCDGENNPPEVVDAGRLVVDIGIAPVKPAEFVIFRIAQKIGSAEGEG